MSDKKPDTVPSAERVAYRDVGEFNKAMDAAADAIRGKETPAVVGTTIWFGLVACQIFLYVTDWIFDWELREKIIPGIDLAKPIWVVIIGMILLHHPWARSQHARILKNRLCLAGGAKLLEVEVDEEESGTCPACERRFSLGEYRRPDENRGRDFRGYIDAKHFDKTTYAAAEHLKKSSGFGFEGDLLGWGWLGLGVSFGIDVVLGWNLLDWLPGSHHHFIWLVTMLVWSGIYAWRVQRMQPGIPERRRCLNCGYSLLHTPTDEQGIGRCPECGGEFAIEQYERPPEKAPDPKADEDAPTPAG